MSSRALDVAGVAPWERGRRSGYLLVWFFGLSLLLFMAQPWSPSVYGVPLQVALIWGLFAWAVLLHGKAMRRVSGMFSRWQWLLIILLAGSIWVRSMLNDAGVLRLGQLATGLMIALLGGLASTSARRRKIVLGAVTFGAVVSSGVAILQYLDLGLWLWQATKYAHVGYIYGGAGLENQPVAFAYSIVGAAVMLAGSWWLGWRWREDIVPLPSVVLFGGSLVVIAGLFVSKSRSGLLGLALGITMAVVWGRGARRSRRPVARRYLDVSVSARALLLVLVWHMVIVVVGGIVIYAFTVRQAAVTEDVRLLTTWQAYLPVIWRNPLGLPSGADIVQEMREAGAEQYRYLLDRGGGIVIAPHNLLLSTGIEYGVLAALALLVLYGSALVRGYHRFLALRRSGDTAAALWVLLMMAVNVSVIAHSWFHNASIAMGEMRNWLWLGLLLQATARVNLRETPAVDA